MVNIDPAKFVEAADAYDAVSQEALNYAIAARGTLAGYGGMAGTDPSGEGFAQAYDQMAHGALQVLFDIAVVTRGFDRMLMASGGTHAQANENAAGTGVDVTGSYVLRPAIEEMSVAPPPTAFGGRPDTVVAGLDDVAMWVWDQIWNLLGTMFPDGDPETLEQAGSAWSGILGDISRLRSQIYLADNSLAGIDSGEVALINTKVNDFAQGLTEFLSPTDGIGQIDDICKEYAQAIRDAREESRQMVIQLVIEVAAGAGISFALSFVTFGAAGAVGAGVIAARIGAVAVRIGAVVQRVAATGGRLAARLVAIAGRLQAAGQRFPRLMRAGIEITSSTVSAVAAETVQGGDANYVAAFGSGFLGGGVTSSIVAPFGRYGQKFVVQALANGAGGAAGTVADLGMRGDEITAASVIAGAGLGVAMSARLPSRRPPASSSAPTGGGSTQTPELNVASSGGSGGSGGGSSSTGGPTARPDYDGPTGAGGELSGSGGEGGAAPSNHGDAPAAQDVHVTPESGSGGGDAPDGSSAVDSPVADGPAADTPPADGSSRGPSTDDPASGTPTVDSPAVDAPAGSPAADTPSTDAPSADSPSADGPATDGPALDGPAGDAPPADGPEADGPEADAPAGDAPPADGPEADAPVADGDTADGAANMPHESPNPKVQTLFDADGNIRSFDDWNAAHGDPDAPLNHNKGEYGELRTQQYMESQGWTRVDASSHTAANGIDGVYTRDTPDGPEYAVIEAKYNTARLDTGVGGIRQMSRDWLEGIGFHSYRLEYALANADPDLRNSILRAFRRGDLRSGLVRVMPDGSVRVRELDVDGFVVRGTDAAFDAMSDQGVAS
ncbi:MAG: hypothetical protein QM611_06925 [Microbacterium sp.]|uniref:WXG100-like domain-containing protein n=1 Tax=Microbacterium sp. TaxID=51671 RepID=UPI0039E6BEE4